VSTPHRDKSSAGGAESAARKTRSEERCRVQHALYHRLAHIPRLIAHRRTRLVDGARTSRYPPCPAPRDPHMQSHTKLRYPTLAWAAVCRAALRIGFTHPANVPALQHAINGTATRSLSTRLFRHLWKPARGMWRGSAASRCSVAVRRSGAACGIAARHACSGTVRGIRATPAGNQWAISGGLRSPFMRC